MLTCDNEEIKGIHPSAICNSSKQIGRDIEGCMLMIDWVLIIITEIETGSIRVEFMGEDYPHEPDIYYLGNLSVAVRFTKAKVKELGL